MSDEVKEDAVLSRKRVSFVLDDYDKVDAFAKKQGLGNVPNLARFAIRQYMSRSWKKKAGKLVSLSSGGKS